MVTVNEAGKGAWKMLGDVLESLARAELAHSFGGHVYVHLRAEAAKCQIVHRSACASSTLSAQKEAKIAAGEGIEAVCKPLGDVWKSLARARLDNSLRWRTNASPL